MNMNTILPFLTTHWPLVLAFIAVLALLLFNNKASSKTQGVTLLSSDAVVSRMNHDNAQVLDVRSAEVFKGGHILGAQNMPVPQSGQLSVSALSSYRSRSLIIVAQSQLQAVNLGAALVKQGFVEVACLQGGISAWREAGLPLVK